MQNLKVIAAVLLTLPSSLWANEISCTVEAVHGVAEGVSGETRRTLELGGLVAIADRIETGDAARVTLVCPDELRITVGPGSSVELVDLDSEGEGWAARLTRGIARFARPLFGGARFEVRTPSAVASVRSTVWTVDVTDNATSLFVTEGLVAIGGVDIAAGQGIDVAADGTLGEVTSWGPERIAVFEARLDGAE